MNTTRQGIASLVDAIDRLTAEIADLNASRKMVDEAKGRGPETIVPIRLGGTAVRMTT